MAIDSRAPLTLSAWLRWDIVRRILATVPEGADVLEIGCGGGAVAARVCDRFSYTGVESDPLSRETAAARARQGPATFLAGIDDLSADAMFDVVCAFEVVEHIKNDRDALAAWVKRLRPNGLIVLSVPQHQHRFGAADKHVGHFRRYGREQMAERLQEAGARDVHLISYGFPLGYALEPVRNAIARRRTAADTLHDRTAGSGRFLQPRQYQGLVTRALSAPFRLAQRPFANTALGTGLVVTGRR